jgi:hypothetical protein
MTASSTSSVSPDRPSQRRRAVGPFRQAFGLLASPLAWSADELFSYGAASYLCRVKTSGSDQALTIPGSPWFWVLIVVTLAIAVAGFVVAIGNWRRTSEVQGADRSRFVALCGVLISGGFLVAFVFMLGNLALAPLCGK